MAENELNIAKQILVGSSRSISCKLCRLTLEVSIDQRIGDLTKSLSDVATRGLSVNNLSLALDLYRSALKKLNLPEWENTLGSLEKIQSDPKELHPLNVKGERSHVNLVPKKSRKTKNASKHLTMEQNLEHGRVSMMTRSRYRASQSKGVQVEELMDSECPKISCLNNALADHDTHNSDYGCEACVVHSKNCWRCLLLKVMESGRMNDFIYMKWEFHHRRLQLRLLIDIGKLITP